MSITKVHLVPRCQGLQKALHFPAAVPHLYFYLAFSQVLVLIVLKRLFKEATFCPGHSQLWYSIPLPNYRLCFSNTVLGSKALATHTPSVKNKIDSTEYVDR